MRDEIEGRRGRLREFLDKYGMVIAATAWGVLFAVTLDVYKSTVFAAGTAKAWVVVLSALLILIGANRAIYGDGPGVKDASYVRYTIAFNAVIAIVAGLAVVVVACKDWTIPFLISVSCLLISGFFGLLFGYPSGVAQQPDDKGTDPTKATPKGPSQDRNLLAESASTLGKFLAGVTVARAKDVSHYFYTLCAAIAPAFGSISDPSDHNILLAGSTLAYFLAVGFLSGILLPSYFMRGNFA